MGQKGVLPANRWLALAVIVALVGAAGYFYFGGQGPAEQPRVFQKDYDLAYAGLNSKKSVNVSPTQHIETIQLSTAQPPFGFTLFTVFPEALAGASDSISVQSNGATEWLSPNRVLKTTAKNSPNSVSLRVSVSKPVYDASTINLVLPTDFIARLSSAEEQALLDELSQYAALSLDPDTANRMEKELGSQLPAAFVSLENAGEFNPFIGFVAFLAADEPTPANNVLAKLRAARKKYAALPKQAKSASAPETLPQRVNPLEGLWLGLQALLPKPVPATPGATLSLGEPPVSIHAPDVYLYLIGADEEAQPSKALDSLAALVTSDPDVTYSVQLRLPGNLNVLDSPQRAPQVFGEASRMMKDYSITGENPYALSFKLDAATLLKNASPAQLPETLASKSGALVLKYDLVREGATAKTETLVLPLLLLYSPCNEAAADKRLSLVTADEAFLELSDCYASQKTQAALAFLNDREKYGAAVSALLNQPAPKEGLATQQKAEAIALLALTKLGTPLSEAQERTLAEAGHSEAAGLRKKAYDSFTRLPESFSAFAEAITGSCTALDAAARQQPDRRREHEAASAVDGEQPQDQRRHDDGRRSAQAQTRGNLPFQWAGGSGGSAICRSDYP